VILLSIDILAVKHYFPPEEAGLYAGIATIARIIYFLAAPITGVLITLVSLKQSDAKNRLQLLGSLGLILLIGGIGLMVMSLMPSQSITLLVGSRYLAYADLLPKLGLVMLILSLANAMLMYNISLRRYVFSVVPVAALGLGLALITQNHRTVSEIINSLLISSSVLMVSTVALHFLLTKQLRRARGPVG
jgi:O-antigen/teichoic acid export membrane protein